MHLCISIFTLLLLTQNTGASQQIQAKQWQEVPTENQEAGGAEYSGGDIASYNQASGGNIGSYNQAAGGDIGSYNQAAGGEYTGGDVGTYGSGYTNDYGGQINNGGYGNSGNSYNSDINGNGYGQQIQGNSYGVEQTSGNAYGGEQINGNGYAADQVSNNGYGGEQVTGNAYGGEQTNSNGYGGEQINGYGGEQINSNGYGGQQISNNGYGGEQINSNGYGGEQINSNGYGGEQINSNGYGGEQINSNGYGGEQLNNVGYGGDVHTTTSYSSSGYGDLSGGNGYGGISLGGDAYSNEGWERPVKTVVKTIQKNVAVPYPVPAPVHIPVPRYVKYLKHFAIAKPFAVPHVIPVIRHIQKPIPFFTAFPVKQSVPVPKFVGLPVQVRVPRPVFIHVPKMVPVAKRVPYPVTVNIPKPYVVPIYKHVPVPVPHKVPKVINVIKEVPHFVKKPVPVYVDENPSGYSNGGGNTLTSTSYSNHYGASDGIESYGAGYAGDDLYGGSPNDIGLGYGKGGSSDYGQQGYDTQSTYIYNNPFLMGRPKFQSLTQQKLQLPKPAYPRAQRTPTKVQEKSNAVVNNQQQQATTTTSTDTNFNSNTPGSGLELQIDLKPGAHGTKVYGTNVQQSGNNNQGQTGQSFNQLYYQNNQASNPTSASNMMAGLKLPLENINTQYSQPLYNPAAYSEYAMNQQYQQQAQYNQTYTEPYRDQKTAQSELSAQGMVAQASKAQYYNQHPGNAYSVGFNTKYQNNAVNSISQAPNFASFSNQKSPYSDNSNFDYSSIFNNNYNQVNEYKNYSPYSTSPMQSNQDYQSPWPPGGYNQNINSGNSAQVQPYSQQPPSAYAQTPSQSNSASYNQGYNNYNSNPSSYSGNQDGYQQTGLRNTESNTNFNNFVPSGSSSSSTSYSESLPSSAAGFQSGTSSLLKQNEKFDQSASQNTFISGSNIALPGMYSESGPSVSYSNSAYGNGYNMQNYAQQTGNQNSNNSPGQVSSASQLNMQTSDSNNYASQNQFNPQSQFSEAGQYVLPSQVSEQSSYSNQNQYNDPSTINHLNSQTYLNQLQQMQPLSNSNNNYPNTRSASYSNFISTGSTSSYSPASSSSSSSTSQSQSNGYSAPLDQNTVQQKDSNTLSAYSNGENGNQQQSADTRSLSIVKPSISSSQSYSFTETKNPGNTYAIIPKSSQENTNSMQTSSSNQVQYSPQITDEDFQSAKSKIDEMEKHIQSSASSIINVYTNSPKSGKNGQTFSFMDPEAMGSSQSATYFQPIDRDGSSKMGFSSSDMTVVPPPSYQDPAEPLQTSLDAYVPPRPVYTASNNDQNTVYKEAISDIDDYKEAISLNSDSPKSS